MAGVGDPLHLARQRVTPAKGFGVDRRKPDVHLRPLMAGSVNSIPGEADPADTDKL